MLNQNVTLIGMTKQKFSILITSSVSVKEAEILPCEREKGVTALRCKVEKFKCLIGCYTPANSKKKREKKKRC
jgi:hypothetical protein